MLLPIISGTVSAYTFDPVYYGPSRMFLFKTQWENISQLLRVLAYLLSST